MALIPPFFFDSVVAIGFGDDPKSRYRATGFLYGLFIKNKTKDKNTYSIYLVTNRHVFEGEKVAVLRFNPTGSAAAREFKVRLKDKDGKPLWFTHDDPEIDVAAIGINARRLQAEGIQFSYFRSDVHVASRAEAVEVGISEGDGVFLLGFPMGLVGETRNVVVVRQGAIARIRDFLEGGSRDFLIDCTVFPGNSGGPVILRPEVTSITGTKPAEKACLLGIVATYIPYEDVAISAQTKQPRIVFQENSGLATVFPVDHINDVVNKAKDRNQN